jgi:hypothetical protein
MDLGAVVKTVEDVMVNEAVILVAPKSVLTYVGSDKDGNTLGGSIASSVEQMQKYIQGNAPVTWQICSKLAQGKVIKPNADFAKMSAILQLMNCTSVFLYANHINKSAIEVLSELNVCVMSSKEGGSTQYAVTAPNRQTEEVD